MDIINDIFNILSEKLPISFLKGNFVLFDFSISRLLVLTAALFLLFFIAAIVVFCILIKKSKKPIPEQIATEQTLIEEEGALSDKSTASAYTPTELYKAAITTDYEDVVVGDEQLDIDGEMDINQIIITDINESVHAAIVDEFDFDIDTDALSDFGNTEFDPITESADDSTQGKEEEDAAAKATAHSMERTNEYKEDAKTAISDTAPLKAAEEKAESEYTTSETDALQKEASEIPSLKAAEHTINESEISELDAPEDSKAHVSDTIPFVAAEEGNESGYTSKADKASEVAAACTAGVITPIISENLSAFSQTAVLPKAKKSPQKERYERSFTAKLIQTEHENKAMYSLLKNLFMNYNSVRNTISWNYESFIYGRNLIARLYLVGKTLRLFLALDPNAYDVNIYHQESKENTAKYRSVPMMVKITSKLALKRAVSLVFDLAKKNGLTKKTVRKNIDYITKYAPQSEDVLIKKGLIKAEDPHKYKLTDSLNNEQAYNKLMEESKSSGKYAFEKKGEKVHFCLYANNDELLMRSPNSYTTVQGAKRGISTFKKAVKEGNFAIAYDGKGYKFILKAQSTRFSYKGEFQITKAHAELAIKKVSLFADIAVILDKVI